MLNFGNELNEFKKRIDLVKYAGSLGFKVDKRKSWSGSTALRNGGDMIIVKRNPKTGDQVFWSPMDRKGGTIIDLAQTRKNLSISEVKAELREWL